MHSPNLTMFQEMVEHVLKRVVQSYKQDNNQFYQDAINDPLQYVTNITTVFGLCFTVLKAIDGDNPKLKKRWERMYIECMTYQDLMHLRGEDHMRAVLLSPCSTDT